MPSGQTEEGKTTRTLRYQIAPLIERDRSLNPRYLLYKQGLSYQAFHLFFFIVTVPNITVLEELFGYSVVPGHVLAFIKIYLLDSEFHTCLKFYSF